MLFVKRQSHLHARIVFLITCCRLLPGEMVAFDLLGPLPKTKRGNTYILLVVDLLSRHAEPHALSEGREDRERLRLSTSKRRCCTLGLPPYRAV